MPVTLYNGMGSAPSTLVRMMAKEAGIDLSLKNVDMANREHLGAEYLKVRLHSNWRSADVTPTLMLNNLVTHLHISRIGFYW